MSARLRTAVLITAFLSGGLPAAATGAAGIPGTPSAGDVIGWGGASNGHGLALWRFGDGTPAQIGPTRITRKSTREVGGDVAIGASTAGTAIYYSACRATGASLGPVVALVSAESNATATDCDVMVAAPAGSRARRAGFSTQRWSESIVGASGPWLAVGRTRSGRAGQVLVLRGGRAVRQLEATAVGLPRTASAARVQVSESGTTWILWQSKWQRKSCGSTAGVSRWLVRLDPDTGDARVVASRACRDYGHGLDLVGIDGDAPLVGMLVLGTAPTYGSSSCWARLSPDGNVESIAPALALTAGDSGDETDGVAAGRAFTATGDTVSVQQWTMRGGGVSVAPLVTATLRPPGAASPAVAPCLEALAAG